MAFAYYVAFPFTFNYFFSLLGTVTESGTELTQRPTLEYYLDFTTRRDASLDALCAELHGGDDQAAQQLAQRLCLVGDDVFSFLCATALEITAHIRLDPDTKTVVKGALWYEETLPAESLLTSFLMSTTGDLSVLSEQRQWYQMGGKGSVGRGLLKLSIMAED